MLKLGFWWLIFCVLVFGQVKASTQKQLDEYKDIKLIAEPDSYVVKLLRAAIAAADTEIKYRIICLPKGDISYSRLIRLMANEQYADIAPLAVTTQRMASLTGVQIPIFFGLQGYRVLLIHNDNSLRFENIDNLMQLRKLRAGFVNGWADHEIFLSNQLPTYIAEKASSVYEMLAMQRVDYFSRSVQEITTNYEEYIVKYPELAIEKHLVLVYPLPVYFFVTPKAAQLAKDVQLGLEAISISGQMEELFLEYYRDKVQSLNLDRRVIIELKNDAMPKGIVLPKVWPHFLQ